MLTKAILKNTPISICTDVNHHFCQYITRVLSDIEKMSGKKIPITLDNKDWNVALKNLINIADKE